MESVAFTFVSSPLILSATASTFAWASEVSIPNVSCICNVFCAVWNSCNNPTASPILPETWLTSTFITAGASNCCF